MGEPPYREAIGELHRLELGAPENGDIGRPFDAAVDGSREERVVVPGRDEDSHGPPPSEGVGEESPRVDPGALVLVEISADRHRQAALLHGQASCGRERVAKPLPAPARELSLTAHGGEHPVEVEVGEMEETYRHGVLGMRAAT
jgi:hypothetical protein